MESSPQRMLNVASTCRETRALGPGLRAAVWVQGCPRACAGCIAPEWIPFVDARHVTPQALKDELLENPAVTGLTFSGGEPMLQAAGLAELIRLARKERDLSLICFTGYRFERLRAKPPAPGVADLLGEIDVLIDGPYVARLNDGLGLRGSRNQHVHYLSDRLRDSGFDFEGRRRNVEIRLDQDGLMLVGVPPIGLETVIDSIAPRAASPAAHVPPAKGAVQ